MDYESTETPLSLGYFDDNQFREFDSSMHDISNSDVDQPPSFRNDQFKASKSLPQPNQMAAF